MIDENKGFETARALANTGAIVVMACRDCVKGGFP